MELTKIFYEELRQSCIFIIASFLVFLEKVFCVWLKDNIDVTQKQISTNQVTMGLVHLLCSFEQPMMEVKNFLQSHLQVTSLKIKKLGPLPAEYTSVKDLYPAQFKNELWAPASSGYVSTTEFSSYDKAVTEELQWFIIYAENLSSELFNQNIYPPG